MVSIWSIDPKLSFVRLGHPIIGLFYAIQICLFFPKKNLRGLIITLAILAISSSSISLILFLSRNNFAYGSIPFLNDFYQLYFSYYITEKKVIPTFTSLIIAFPLIYIFHQLTNLKHLATFGFILVTISFILYASRANFAVYALSIFCLFWLIPTSRKFFKKILITLFFLLIINAAYAYIAQEPSVISRFLLIRNIDRKTALSRVSYAMKSFAIFKQNPLTGIGYGNYEIVSSLDHDGPLPIVDPHNIFFLHLGETGLIGTLGLLSMFITFIVQDYFYLRIKDKTNVTSIILLVSSWAYMAINMFEPSLHSRMVIFFILRSMLIIQKK